MVVIIDSHSKDICVYVRVSRRPLIPGERARKGFCSQVTLAPYCMQEPKNTFLKHWADSNGHCVGQGAVELTAAFGKEEEEERKISCHFLQTTDLGMLRCSGSNRITPPPLGLRKRGRDLQALWR